MAPIVSLVRDVDEASGSAPRQDGPIWLAATSTKTAGAARKKTSKLKRLLARGRSLATRHTRELILGLGAAALGLSVLISSSGGASVRPHGAHGNNAKAAQVLDAGPEERERAESDTEWEEAPDPARDLLLKITGCEFASREDVATGRFLRDFDAQAVEFTALDLNGMKLLARGENWVRIEAPWNAASVASARRKETVRLRMVESNGNWKIEHFKVLPPKGKA